MKNTDRCSYRLFVAFDDIINIARVSGEVNYRPDFLKKDCVYENSFRCLIFDLMDLTTGRFNFP